jgi:hypothetical protein
MELYAPKARVLTSIVTGLLMLLGRPMLAAGPEPATQPAPNQVARSVGRSEAAANEQLLKKVDQLFVVNRAAYNLVRMGS